MTREEAIAIIRKEYLCVERDCDIERSCGKCDLKMPSKEPILQAYKMAIKALEQEPCEDAISREDALLALTGEWTELTDEIIHRFIKRIKSLPPVNAQPKTGYWKQISPAEIYEYSECGQNVMTSDICAYRFCHGCGAKMVEPQERQVQDADSD